MGATEHLRVHAVEGSGRANVDTGLPVLDHLLTLVAEYGCFDLVVALAPGEASAEIGAAARGLGAELGEALRAPGARGYGSAALPAGEALAHIALERSDRPLLVTNVDLTATHVGGVAGDVVAEFLRELAEGAGMTLHVRLISGDDAQHVLEATFKALGVALSQACRTRAAREER
jgi:imidazoleglycerol-phosphate dehydratase